MFSPEIIFRNFDRYQISNTENSIKYHNGGGGGGARLEGISPELSQEK